ncbi:hypothetical protein BN1708_003614 [Verticillium longisporum]|uniref:F-box domain-containing protein n=1 Tax=Verticillium longisporum TaxID=100787 RepID=A0A0G4LKZ4_VERLO|nr:hypothetical protein BN1708_003614 [Verticillium longisporum]
MPDMQESIASPALTEVVDEQNPDLHEVPVKKGNRQRLLHRIQRISSSPSLVSIGRPRARSTPYRGKGHLSCVSLSGGPITSITDGSDSYFPAGASASDYANASDRQAGTPASEKARFDANVRRIETGVTPFNPLTPGAYTIGLPTDIKPVPKILLATPAIPKKNFDFWKDMPHEISVHIFSFLRPKELVQASRISKSFHELCFDGQLWTSFDASQFHDEIPAESLAKIIVAAGPFIKDLNLRGCVQVEHCQRAEVVVKSCQNLLDATLEGCRNFQRSTLHALLRNNSRLANLNLTGLTAVTNMSCTIIAEACPQLQRLDVSWCTHMDARGIKAVVKGCAKLTDLRAREIRGFDNLEVAEVLYRTNNLERLILNGCADLDDRALKVMVQGEEPEIDILTDIPVVPRRKWRHLDLSRCTRLTSRGVRALGHLTPDLEGLQLSGCTALTDTALETILASTPRLTHLELEDLAELTNAFLSEHLAKAPCAPHLEHLSLGYCEDLGDAGMLPVVKNCIRLQNIDLDNTRISDLVLAEAAHMVNKRAKRTTDSRARPSVSLNMVVYDCQNVTWTGVREVLFRNAHVKPDSYPMEVIGLKAFYGFQMTIDEHMKRESIASAALTEVVDEQNPDLHEVPIKKGNRQRLLHRIQRISSSPSLVSIGRPRARSTPYRGKGHLSCVSLSGAPIASITDGSDSYFPAGASASDYANASDRQAGTPASEKAHFDANVRRIETGVTPFNPLTPGAYTIGLPTDIKTVSKILLANHAMPKKNFDFWKDMPHEISVHIFSFLRPKQLVQASRTSKSFHGLCFDGQLWTSFDASQFHDEIPAESLAKIIVAAGPFIKDLNLRGCVQVEHYHRAEVVVKACQNLLDATLEGCRNFQRIIGLKAFYGFQMTIDEHMKRVLRGDFAAASRLERRWADYMQANEEAGATGAGHRRRRRRAREAQMLHADEEEGGIAHAGRRRARTVAAACAVM